MSVKEDKAYVLAAFPSAAALSVTVADGTTEPGTPALDLLEELLAATEHVKDDLVGRRDTWCRISAAAADLRSGTDV